MQITLLRTVMDFASIVGDSTKRNEARALAILLVGFTGLPILIGITQAIILLAWSFAEALLDVCALMMGKEIPVIKKKTPHSKDIILYYSPLRRCLCLKSFQGFLLN